jgi:hypothetical protein
MNMNMNKICFAVATTLVAGQAMATVDSLQSAVNTARGNATTLNEGWISGASAPTLNIFNAFKSGCKATTPGTYDDLTIYTTATAAGVVGGLGNFNAYVCTNTSDQLTVMYHSVDNGSFTAYTPHISGQAASLTNLKRVANIGANANCTASTATNGANLYISCSSLSTTAVQRTSTPTKLTGPLIPAGGFSDVEAALFGYNLKSSEGVEADLKVNQTFGIVVTPSLYRAMQAAQGVSANDIAADTAYSAALAPNITSQQYANMIRQSTPFVNWSYLMPNDANKTNVVTILRRPASSGTQAASNAFFLQNPCAKGKAGGFLAPLNFAEDNDGTTYNVTESSSTGNLKIAFKAKDDSDEKYGIGVMSLENNWATESAANSYYRFIKLDGVHPETGDATYATANSMNGTYKFFMAMKSFIATSQASTYGATLITNIGAALSQPTEANCDSSKLRGLFLDKFSTNSCTKSTVSKQGVNCSPIKVYAN